MHVGDLETLAQLTSAEVLRVKTSVLENRQLPRITAIEGNLPPLSSFLSQTLYHVVREIK